MPRLYVRQLSTHPALLLPVLLALQAVWDMGNILGSALSSPAMHVPGNLSTVMTGSHCARLTWTGDKPNPTSADYARASYMDMGPAADDFTIMHQMPSM